MNRHIEPPARNIVGVAIAVTVLGLVAWLALIPNNRGQFLGFLPEKLRRWICEHDDFNNITGFWVLGIVAFCLPSADSANRGSGLIGLLCRVFAHRLARLAALMGLVCALEILQFVIPGRFSDLRDVCTGWSGLFAAWLVSEVRNANATRRG